MILTSGEGAYASENTACPVRNSNHDDFHKSAHLTQVFNHIHHIHTFLSHILNLLAPELFFFLILAHPVYKMWIIQEPNTLELWNKLHFEEGEKTESIYRV